MMDWFRTLDQSLKTRLKKFQIFLKPTALSSGKYVDLDFMYIPCFTHKKCKEFGGSSQVEKLRDKLKIPSEVMTFKINWPQK